MSPSLRNLFAVAGTVLCTSPAHAEVHLRTGTIGPADALSQAAIATRASEPDLYVVSARAGIDPEFRRRLVASGMVEVAYLPDRAVAAWGTPSALARVVADATVEFAAELPPYLRVGPELRELTPEQGALVEVMIVPGVSAVQAADDLARLGLEILGSGPGPRFNRVVARVPAGNAVTRIDAAAAVSGVFSITRRPVYRLLNDDSIWVGQAGMQAPGQTPIFDAGIHGEGQVVAVLDTGLDPDMCFFRDPAGLPPVNTNFGTASDPTQRKVIAYDFLWTAEDPADPRDWDTQGHGTHVAGSVGGDNLAAPIAHNLADGMAPAAKLVIQDAGYAVDDCGDIPALGCPMVDLTPYFEQTYIQGARLHTNSWGDQENASPQNNYTAACIDADDYMWTHPDFLLLFAAGNSGPGDDTVGSPSVAKNVISVGATQHGSSADSMANFSSRGWAKDGRIKPTLTCPGSAIVSASNDGDINTNNCGTVAFSGTSMASPTCAGHGALVRQYFTDGFYPSGRARATDAFTPSAALVKAALINSSRNMTGTAAVISRSQGFGRVTLADTLALPAGSRQLFVADEANYFPNGSVGTKAYTINVLSPTQPLKVTLVWTDYPSNTLAAKNLVNDLDLVVSGPGGTFNGNVFSGGFSTQGGNADRTNVEEEVWIQNPGEGTWTLTVKAAAVPQGPQGFALVATADLPDPPGVLVVGSTSDSDDLDPACTDHDGAPDNGETFRFTVSVKNPAESPATDVRATLTSLSPYLSVASANPVVIATLAPGAIADADFDVRVTGAPCRADAMLEASITSAENLTPATSSHAVVLEGDLGAQDVVLNFETGLDDSAGIAWSASGGFAISTARQNSGTSSLWAGVAPGPGVCNGSGNSDGGNACARLLSPTFLPQAGSTLVVANWYQFERFSSSQFWDRGNVHVIEGGQHTIISPSSGRGYDSANGHSTTLCHINVEDGWAGNVAGTSWANSTFNLSAWAGRSIQVEVNYNTDGSSICEGLYLDDLRLTNVLYHECDGKLCVGSCVLGNLTPLSLLKGAKSGGLAATWTWQDAGTGASEYHLNSVLLKTDLPGPDPASAHLAPRGRGSIECAVQNNVCTDADALGGPSTLLFYRVFSACGPAGSDEGAP